MGCFLEVSGATVDPKACLPLVLPMAFDKWVLRRV